MIGNFILAIICVIAIAVILYSLYNSKSINNVANIDKDENSDYNKLLKATGYVDKLKPAHLSSFYRLFTNK
ncbi:MV maturation protein [Cotia virus SPAn232]|uniref:MV maturation protein n=2 Tax=Cotia virus TaxID=39444 RepID=H6TAK3_9POXV|nr:MV maturation protein [Cotia virus SPAn232]AFB76940.1 MV maturation protein [Cotia virus SPAn232]AIT70736.1 MV maturation protein [Cotia virus]